MSFNKINEKQVQLQYQTGTKYKIGMQSILHKVQSTQMHTVISSVDRPSFTWRCRPPQLSTFKVASKNESCSSCTHSSTLNKPPIQHQHKLLRLSKIYHLRPFFSKIPATNMQQRRRLLLLINKNMGKQCALL